MLVIFEIYSFYRVQLLQEVLQVEDGGLLRRREGGKSQGCKEVDNYLKILYREIMKILLYRGFLR